MIDFVNYIFESGISMGLFTLLYLLLLQKETFFRTNRYFLLFALFFSLALPLFHLRVYDPQPVMLGEITVLPYRNLMETVSVYGTSVSESIVRSISASTYLLAVYLLGVVFFSMRLLIRILRIVSLIRQNEVVEEQGMKLVILKRETSPFSFLSHIFISDHLRQQPGWKKMLIHEYEHVKQGHSFDILVLEIISVFQWCNPFFWLLKRVLRENHEYLADRAVLKHGENPLFYKQLLLSQFIGPEIFMASNFNYSLIKKRIKMMSKIKSSGFSQMKLLSGILVAMALVVVFACEKKTAVRSEEMPDNRQKITLNMTGDTLELKGDSSAVRALKDLLSKNPDIEISALQDGGLNIQKKSNDVQGIYAIARDQGTEEAKKDSVFFIVEDMPEFPGGERALRKFIAGEIRYPEEAVKKGISGKVYVNFVVEEDGSTRRIKIARGVDPSLDREALRVISQLPKWTPGKQKGKAVAVSYTVPISFVLQ